MRGVSPSHRRSATDNEQTAKCQRVRRDHPRQVGSAKPSAETDHRSAVVTIVTSSTTTNCANADHGEEVRDPRVCTSVSRHGGNQNTRAGELQLVKWRTVETGTGIASRELPIVGASSQCVVPTPALWIATVLAQVQRDMPPTIGSSRDADTRPCSTVRHFTSCSSPARVFWFPPWRLTLVTDTVGHAPPSP